MPYDPKLAAAAYDEAVTTISLPLLKLDFPVKLVFDDLAKALAGALDHGENKCCCTPDEECAFRSGRAVLDRLRSRVDGVLS